MPQRRNGPVHPYVTRLEPLKKAAPHAFREAPKIAAPAEGPAAAHVRPEPVRRPAAKAVANGSDEGWQQF